MNEEQLNQTIAKAINLSGAIAGLTQPNIHSSMKVSMIIKYIAPAGLKHPNKWANKLLKTVVERKNIPQGVIVEDGVLKALTATVSGLEYREICCIDNEVR